MSLRDRLLSWCDEQARRIEKHNNDNICLAMLGCCDYDEAWPLVLRALRQEVEAHMWSNPNLPEGLGDRYYRCVGCDETWPLVEPCPTILRIAQALGVSRWQE